MFVMLAMLFALTVTAGRGHFAVRGA